MNEGGNEFDALMSEASRLFGTRSYREALAKYKSALAMAQKSGDERQAIQAHMSIISCHDRLGEVSCAAVEEFCEKADVFLSLSM